MSLDKAKKEIEGLKSTVSNLETSLAASKEQVVSTQRSLEVRSGAHLSRICLRATILSVRSPPDPIGASPPLLYSRVDAGSRFFISQDEKAAGKEAAVNAAKAAKEFDSYRQQVASAEKATDTTIADLKQQMAVLKANLEQTQAALNEEKSKAKDATHAHSNAAAELDRKLDATRTALEEQKKATADFENKLNTAKAQLEANAKEAESSRQELNSKITSLSSELTAAKTQTADWQREADKSKGEAEKARAAADAAINDKHAAQEARVLAEKDTKSALEAKSNAEAERAERDRDAKEANAASKSAKDASDKLHKELESLTVKYTNITEKHTELSENSKVKSAADEGKIASLNATLVEKDAAIASLKEQYSDVKRSLSSKLAEETAGHEGTKQSLERLKQEAYNLYTAYTGCMQQLEEYRVALERESQESARLHQAMATQKQEAARDAFRTSKSMLLPPSSIAGLGGGGNNEAGGFGNFGSFGAKLSELNPDGSSPYSASKTKGDSGGDDDFAVD